MLTVALSAMSFDTLNTRTCNTEAVAVILVGRVLSSVVRRSSSLPAEDDADCRHDSRIFKSVCQSLGISSISSDPSVDGLRIPKPEIVHQKDGRFIQRDSNQQQKSAYLNTSVDSGKR